MRRFEILFPQQYNDGSEIPRKLRGRALKEIVDQFGAASFEPTAIEGYWHHEGILAIIYLTQGIIPAKIHLMNRANTHHLPHQFAETFQSQASQPVLSRQIQALETGSRELHRS